jgi:hypothetical protein
MDEVELDRREVEWPPPADDPPVEPAEPWARIAERKLGEELVEWEEWEKWRSENPTAVPLDE